MLGRALAVKVAQSLAISMLRCTVVSNGENPPKISSLDVISRVFSSKFHQIHLINVSGHCMHFIFKICQSVPGISITKYLVSQFHEFSEFYFWRIFATWANCEQQPSLLLPSRRQMEEQIHGTSV